MNNRRNDPCWCGSGKKRKKCHPQDEPTSSGIQSFSEGDKYKELRALYYKKYQIVLKTPEQVIGIRKACLLAADILDKICAMAKEGVTTEELNAYANKLHKEANAIPAPLNYGHPPYPKSICTSLNEVICHGIPDKVPLKIGDILNIDVSCILDGYFGDCSKMVAIGEISAEKGLVMDTAYECLMLAIEALKPGIPLSRIGDVIEEHAAKRKCSVVNQFVAHGIGMQFHEAPQVPHHRNTVGILLVPGMTFTIEPMINAGVREAVIDPRDQWTARTRDGKASAQWEHTLLITEEGFEILTPWTK